MTLLTPSFNDAKTYDFGWLRYLSELTLKEGVIGSGDMKVTAAGGGGMKVDIAAGTALVKGDSGTPAVGVSQGLYTAINDASIANAVTLSASDGTNPRIDQICLRVRDSSDLATGADDATFLVVTGTPTGGATLDNRNGATALPNDHLRLADILVPAGSSSVSAGNVRDRRPWARGACLLVTRTSGNVTVNAGFADFDTNFSPRLELGGNPLEVRFLATGSHVSATGRIGRQLLDNGAIVPGTSGPQYYSSTSPSGASQQINLLDHWALSLAAGTHKFQLQTTNPDSGSGAATIDGVSTRPATLFFREHVVVSANNT